MEAMRHGHRMDLYELHVSEPVAYIDDEGHVCGDKTVDQLPRVLFGDVPVMLHLSAGISVAPLAGWGAHEGPLPKDEWEAADITNSAFGI